jgi:hypothetical protein
MMNRDFLKTHALKLIVLDEADNMLSRGFEEQIRDIFNKIPADIQVGLFSATMPPEILELTKKFMRDPATILVKNEELTLDGIKQYYIPIDKEEWKFLTLVELYKNLEIQQCIIFCNLKQQVEDLAEKFKNENFVISLMVHQYYSLIKARRNEPGPKGTRHEGVQDRLLPSPHHHRPPRQRNRRPTGPPRHQLRPPQREGNLHP